MSTNREYNPRLQSLETDIRETQGVITTQAELIGNLQIKKKEREQFLKEAQEKLTQFKMSVDAHEGMYIPADKIPQTELIKYLECNSDSDFIRFLEELYKKEQAGNAWYGWNLTYLRDSLVHNTALLQSGFDFELTMLSDYIAHKMELIESELGNGKPTGTWFAKENLWSLQESSQMAAEQKKQSEGQVAQLVDEQEKLGAKKKEKLDGLDKAKAGSEQILSKEQLSQQLGEFNNNLAVLALDALNLDYKLTDIEENEKKFDNAFREFVQLENEALVEQTEGRQEELGKISDSLTRATGWEKSVADLVKKLGYTLSALEKEWKEISELAMDTKPPTALDPLIIGELQDLRKQVDAPLGLNATYAMLCGKIADQQEALPLLKELAEIQIKSTELLKKADSLADYSPDDRSQLYADIQHFERQIERRMSAISESQNTSVKEKYATTVRMREELIQAKNTIEVLEKLAEINFVYFDFVQRVNACKPAMLLARRKLLQEIDVFTRSELGTSLAEIRKNNDPIVQKELKPVLEMFDQIDFFSKIYTPTPNSIFAESEAKEDEKYLSTHLDQIIDGYTALTERLDALPPLSAAEKEKLHTDIADFEESKLVTSLGDLRNKADYLHDIHTLVEANADIRGQIERIKQLEGELAEFKENYKPEEIKKEKAFDEARRELHAEYFDKEASTFKSYLKERGETFWFRDLISSIAAFTLGCFGYKTEAQKREEYLKELEQALHAYQEQPDVKDSENSNYTKLHAKIDEGITQFSPRNKSGEEGYDKSLHAKLSALKTEVTTLHIANPKMFY